MYVLETGVYAFHSYAVSSGPTRNITDKKINHKHKILTTKQTRMIYAKGVLNPRVFSS